MRFVIIVIKFIFDFILITTLTYINMKLFLKISNFFKNVSLLVNNYKKNKELKIIIKNNRWDAFLESFFIKKDKTFQEKKEKYTYWLTFKRNLWYKLAEPGLFFLKKISPYMPPSFFLRNNKKK